MVYEKQIIKSIQYTYSTSFEKASNFVLNFKDHDHSIQLITFTPQIQCYRFLHGNRAYALWQRYIDW